MNDLRKQILAVRLAWILGVDENVRERRRGVRHERRPLEGVKQRRLICLLISLGALSDDSSPSRSTSRSMFFVLTLALSASSSITRRGNRETIMRPVRASSCPLVDVTHSKRLLRMVLFFLTTRMTGLELASDSPSDTRGDAFGEVAALVAGGEGVGSWMAAASGSDADRATSVARQGESRVESEETLVQTSLGLAAERIVEAGQDNDEVVPGIRRLADQAGVVRGLSRLHLADHHAATVPGSLAPGVLESPSRSSVMWCRRVTTSGGTRRRDQSL